MNGFSISLLFTGTPPAASLCLPTMPVFHRDTGNAVTGADFTPEFECFLYPPQGSVFPVAAYAVPADLVTGTQVFMEYAMNTWVAKYRKKLLSEW